MIDFLFSLNHNVPVVLCFWLNEYLFWRKQKSSKLRVNFSYFFPKEKYQTRKSVFITGQVGLDCNHRLAAWKGVHYCSTSFFSSLSAFAWHSGETGWRKKKKIRRRNKWFKNRKDKWLGQKKSFLLIIP